MATPRLSDNQQSTVNAHGVELPVRARKTPDSVNRKAQAARLKNKHSVAFEKLASR